MTLQEKEYSRFKEFQHKCYISAIITLKVIFLRAERLFVLKVFHAFLSQKEQTLGIYLISEVLYLK